MNTSSVYCVLVVLLVAAATWSTIKITDWLIDAPGDTTTDVANELSEDFTILQ